MKEFGADCVTTEMVNAVGLTIERKNSKTGKYVVYHESEHPIGLQIFGSDPERMADAGAIGEELGFDFIDVNMGCPVKKVLKTGAGAAILKNPTLAGEIVKEIKKRVSIPVTAKIRVGWTPNDETYIDVVAAMASEGVDGIFVHGRPVSWGMKGPILTDKIAEIKTKFPDLFLVANGGIETKTDLDRVISSTGCDAVMIGRGALKNPLIFMKLKGFEEHMLPEKGTVILKHYDMHADFYGERAPVLFRKFLSWYTKGHPGSSDFRSRANKIDDPQEMRREIQRFFLSRHAHI